MISDCVCAAFKPGLSGRGSNGHISPFLFYVFYATMCALALTLYVCIQMHQTKWKSGIVAYIFLPLVKQLAGITINIIFVTV